MIPWTFRCLLSSVEIEIKTFLIDTVILKQIHQILELVSDFYNEQHINFNTRILPSTYNYVSTSTWFLPEKSHLCKIK